MQGRRHHHLPRRSGNPQHSEAGAALLHRSDAPCADTAHEWHDVVRAGIGAAGASQKPKGCKHQSSSGAHGNLAAAIGQPGPRPRPASRWPLSSTSSHPGQAPGPRGGSSPKRSRAPRRRKHECDRERGASRTPHCWRARWAAIRAAARVLSEMSGRASLPALRRWLHAQHVRPWLVPDTRSVHPGRH
jgi:hypothetical protein